MKYKIISENKYEAIYEYKNDYEKLCFYFDKIFITVRISYKRFYVTDNKDEWTTQTDTWLKYSCRYGHWQEETPALSHEDIKFIDKVLNSMEGDEENENI